MIPSRLTAEVSATDAAIQKKIYRSGMIILKISNKGVKDIMKIVKSLEESGLSAEGVSEAIENKLKVQNFGIQKYYQNTRFNGVDSINNLPKIKDNKS